MRTIIIRCILIWSSLLVGPASIFGQDGAGTSTADNSIVYIASGVTEQRFSETSYFGPNAEWKIDGVLEIWSKKIWISPTAKFTGSGQIIIRNPGENPYYQSMANSATEIDGNNAAFLLPSIILLNPNNIILKDIADPGYGTQNPSRALAAALNIGGKFEFGVDGGDIILNGNDLGLSSSAELKNYDSKRMIVTGNRLAGHVKKDFLNNTSYFFPIGIKEEDYTPAEISSRDASQIFVSVIDYTAKQFEQLSSSRGMNRAWQIYSNTSISVNSKLYHSSNTNNTLYNDAQANIMQYQNSNYWAKGIGKIYSEGIHGRDDISLITNPLSNLSWFTKLNEAVGPIAVDDLFIGISEMSILENDELGNGNLATPQLVTVDLDLTIPGIQTEITVQNEGIWRYNSLTGKVTFVPNSNFVENPSPLVYRLTEKSTNLFSDATITIQIAPRLTVGIAKKLTNMYRELNGSQTATFVFTVKNYGNLLLENLSIVDDLRSVFPSPIDISVKNIQASGNLRPNLSYNGIDNINLVEIGSSLDVNQSETVTIVVNLLPNGKYGTFYNSAIAKAMNTKAGTTTDESTDGTNPDPNNNKKPDDTSENVKTQVVLTRADIKIPGGFSPNGDGINDKFIIENAGNAVIDIEIYNRWGNIVYKNKNYKNEWDGTVNTGVYLGQNVPDGTYYYIVKIDGEVKPVKFITVNR